MAKTITKIFAVLMAIALCACLFSGCTGNPTTEKEVSKNSSFVIVEDGVSYYVVYHKDTKVMYALSAGGHSFGVFCLLVNPDGTPMIWEGE